MGTQKFSDALLKAVDFAFDSLGKSCHQALYFHLEKTFQLPREEIPSKVKEFDNAIKLIFKDGAVYLEKLILEKLCEDLGVKFEVKQGFGFVDTVSKVKSIVSEKESLLIISDFSKRVVVTKRKRGRMENLRQKATILKHERPLKFLTLLLKRNKIKDTVPHIF